MSIPAKRHLSAQKKSETAFSHVKDFLNAGIFFPLANVANFSQGGNLAVSHLAIGNFAYAVLLNGIESSVKRLPEQSPLKNTYLTIRADIEDTTPAKDIVHAGFRQLGREIFNPLRVTSYCALIAGGLLLTGANGESQALFPGLAALSFGIGNFIQSSVSLKKFRENPATHKALLAALHPAVWYGVGYTMTGIGIGGGMSLLANPSAHMVAASLTGVGVAETAGSLALMASGKINNPAAPFVMVAAGTFLFAVTGLATGNMLGAATGFLACAGEVSLAILTQKQQNMLPSSRAKAPTIFDKIAMPIRAAMKAGLISPTL